MNAKQKKIALFCWFSLFDKVVMFLWRKLISFLKRLSVLLRVLEIYTVTVQFTLLAIYTVLVQKTVLVIYNKVYMIAAKWRSGEKWPISEAYLNTKSTTIK